MAAKGTRRSTKSASTEVVMPRRLAAKAVAASPASAVTKGQAIPVHTSYLNTSVQSYRFANNPVELLRKLAHTDGVVSTAVVSLVQVANSGYRVCAYSRETGRFDRDGTLIAMSIMATMDTLQDYSLGFASKRSVATAVSQALREVVITGALAMELVLDKMQLPSRFQIVDYNKLRMVSRGDGTFYPEQAVSGSDPIPLDIPNFFVAELLKDADKVYADSLLEGAANTSVYFIEFIEDIRRVVHTSGHPRIVANLNAEKVYAAAKAAGYTKPQDIQNFMDGELQTVKTLLEEVQPNQALVSYDTVEFDHLSSDNDKADYATLIQAISNMLATSLKSSPSILGMRGQGSQSLSNTESLVFLKNAKSIQVPVEEVFSRALTLGARLFGFDVYCKFKFNNINLRPEDELESFNTQREEKLLKKLSLGLISDDEYAWETGNFPLPDTYKPLSGTHFYALGPTATDSTKTNADKSKPQEKALEPDTPESGGGKDNREKQ